MQSNPGVIKQVEHALLQAMDQKTAFDLTGLVAIFTHKEYKPWCAVFNEADPPGLLSCFEALSLTQFLDDKRDLFTDFNGIVIAFDALGLIRPDIVTGGSRFFPMDLIYRRVHQTEKLPQTKLNLARTLFSILLAKGELAETLSEFSPNAWLKKTADLFKLSLPRLLERYPLEGLVAIVPDENFKCYIDQQQCSLVYITEPTGNKSSGSTTAITLEHFAGEQITTKTQLCAAFEEVQLFNHGINPRTAGFVDLRKELRRSFYSKGIRRTLEQFTFLCEQRSSIDNRFVQPARALAIENKLADQELDDIIGMEFSGDHDAFPNSSVRHYYYLRLPESAGSSGDIATLDDLLSGKVKVEPENYIVSLSSLRELFSCRVDVWHPLSDVLLRLDRPQVLARSSYLTSLFLSEREVGSIDAEKIADEAAISCHMYSLAEPYYSYWPRGNHRHQLLQSYQNFHEQLDRLTSNAHDRESKNYYLALKIWWDYQEHGFKQRKKLLEEAVKDLGFIVSIEGSESARQYSAASQLYQLFSTILRMFSRAWQPARLRERLSQAGYDQIVRDDIINSWDILNIRLDPKQPSLLFLDRLNEFITLCETSYAIRIKEPDPYSKDKQLTKIGAKLGQQIGLNFDNYMRRYRASDAGLQASRVVEASDEVEALPNSTGINLSKALDDLLLLPEHERLWMKCLYYSAIEDLAAIIYTLQSRPVHGQITPTEVTQYESTTFAISLVGKMGERIGERKDVEVVLSISKDYEIRSRIVRKRFGTSQPVEFTVAFHTSGNVALLFEYIVDNKKHFSDEAWINVIELDSQTRWIGQPYQYGTEIVNPKNHYGRRQELEKVLNHLRAMSGGGERQNFRLHGIKRSGKTSLLNMIRRTIEDPETRRFYHIPEEMNVILDKWHPVLYNLQRLPYDTDVSRGLNSKVFFRYLIEQICKSFHWTDEVIQGTLLRLDTAFAGSADIVSIIEIQLEQILAELPSDHRILVLLDEVDLLDIEKDSRFFGQLRSMINSPELIQITWILTSTRVLQAPGEGIESPLHNIFAPIVLRNLDVTEARRLILEPAYQENIYFEPDATYSILQQTGRQPFFLQVVCSSIVDQLRVRQTSYVSKTLADEVMKQLLEPGTAITEQCQLLWDWVPLNSRFILSLLAHQPQGMSKRELIEQSRAVLLAQNLFSDLLFNISWEDLRANDLVSQDQNNLCRLTIPMFQRWLQQRELDPSAKISGGYHV